MGKRPPRERKVQGLNPACTEIFPGSSNTSDLKIGTPVATLPGAWRYRVSAGTCVTLQALSSTPINPHSCFAWSYKALAMLVDCMWSFGWRLEGGGEDSHKACNLFDN